ncbi:MAG: DUF721 domain-containing protein [Bacteroidales bacterium]|nr:DUF721 domain-containing protein [Bacteroidales bacterium]
MNKVQRKEAVSLGDALTAFLKRSRLASGLNTRRVFAAWDEASGAGGCTLKRFFRDGTLYITTSSSVVCSQLKYRKEALLDRMNDILSADELFVDDGTGPRYVKELKLK